MCECYQIDGFIGADPDCEQHGVYAEEQRADKVAQAAELQREANECQSIEELRKIVGRVINIYSE